MDNLLFVNYFKVILSLFGQWYNMGVFFSIKKDTAYAMSFLSSYSTPQVSKSVRIASFDCRPIAFVLKIPYSITTSVGMLMT